MNKIFIYCLFLILVISGGCASLEIRKPVIKTNTLTAFVVRHAEAYKNLPFHSHMPKEEQDSLTPAGVKQARRTGEYLKNTYIVAVVASPTGRTRQTASIIAEEVGLNGIFSEDPAFKSMAKGKTREGKPVTWSWRESQWKAGHDPRPSGGESLRDATERAVRGVETLIKQYPKKSVVIVTHIDICAGLAGHAEKTPFHERYTIHGVGLGALVEIEIGPQGNWRLK